MVEIDIYSCCRIIEQKPARFRNAESVGLVINQNKSDTQGCFQKTFCGIYGKFSLFSYLLDCHAIVAVAQHIHNAIRQHYSCRLENDRTESDKFGEALRLAGVHRFLGVFFL